MNNTKLLVLSLISLVLSSCGKQDLCDCLKSTGEMQEEIRISSDFNSIELRDNVDLYLRQDSICTIKVVAGENLIKGIITDCLNGSLMIRNTNSCNWVRNMGNPVSVYISVPDLTRLTYKAYGNIITEDTLRMQELRIDVVDGSGSLFLWLRNSVTRLNMHEGVVDVQLSGRTGVSYIYNHGIGPVDALNLKSDITFITNNSIGNSYVHVLNMLDARIEYHSNIYYRGNPSGITASITGSGQLIPY